MIEFAASPIRRVVTLCTIVRITVGVMALGIMVIGLMA